MQFTVLDIARAVMQTMTLPETSRKRFHDGELKLQASYNNHEIIDLTNDSEEDSTSTSKRAKSPSLHLGQRTTLPYVTPASSIDHTTPPISIPSTEVFIKKTPQQPIFQSPSWQNKKISHQRDGAGLSNSPTPNPTTLSAAQRQNKTPETSHFSNEREIAPTSQSTILNADRVKTGKQNGSYASTRLNKATLKPGVQEQGEEDYEDMYKHRYKVGAHSSRDKDHATLRSSAVTTSKQPDIPKNRLEPSKSNPLIFHANDTPKYINGSGNAASARRQRTSAASVESAVPGHPTWKRNEETASAKAEKFAGPITPQRNAVVVEIKTRFHHETPEPSESASRALLDKFRQRLPKPDADGIKGNSRRQTRRDREAYLLAELKKDTSIARTRASSVEEIFGSHGLSKHYDVIGTIGERKPLAQPKAKKVNRSQVKLDRSIPQPATTFNPADVIPPIEQAKRILDTRFEDASSGALLTFFNDKNDRQIDGKFQFVDSYIYRGAVPKMQSGPADVGCLCFKECDPTDKACGCLHLRTLEGEKPVAYVRRQGGLVVLKPDFIGTSEDTRQEIFECNDACSCSKDCFNRVVQKGRTIPLQIFMTEHCGFGIRSPRPIKKGQFIDVYLGELLTTKAVEDYELAITEQSSSYVFSLDYFDEDASYHIQGLHFGSPTRFINHSCNPNTRTFTVMMHHADQKIYKLAYFAIKDIPAMKEITFNYCPDTGDEEPWVPIPGEEEEHVVRCLCGEKNCRGRIWPRRQMATRKGRGLKRH